VASARSQKGAGLEDLQGQLDEWVLWHHTLRRPSQWWQAGAPRQTPQVHQSRTHRAGPDAAGACKQSFTTNQRLPYSVQYPNVPTSPLQTKTPSNSNCRCYDRPMAFSRTKLGYTLDHKAAIPVLGADKPDTKVRSLSRSLKHVSRHESLGASPGRGRHRKS
jgi:hypothetical protein